MNPSPCFWSRLRARFIALGMVGVFGVLAVHASQVALIGSQTRQSAQSGAVMKDTASGRRANMLDRNEALLATSLTTWSLFADPRAVWDAADIVRDLQSVFPDLDAPQLTERLSDNNRAFAWVRRGLTPRQKQAVLDLGLEGLGFKEEWRRVYPGKTLAGHVLGHVGWDGRGYGGLELTYQDQLAQGGEPLRLTLDLAVQEALEEELRRATEQYSAKGAAGLVIDVSNGALRAVASSPAMDPHRPAAIKGAQFNRATGGVFELGSVFKPLTMAAALDAGLMTPDESIDVSQPVKIGSYIVEDTHRRSDTLYPWEIIAYSSNVGTARIAGRLGPQRLRAFLDRIGLSARPDMAFPGIASPLLPARWTPLSSTTVSFGHGIAVSPLSLAMAYVSVANGGIMLKPRLIEPGVLEPILGQRVMKEETAQQIVSMLRAVVVEGTGRRANIRGYQFAGKTGTAEKPGPEGYDEGRNICSFIGLFPASEPKYVVMIMLDEPVSKQGHTQSSALNAAPVAGRLVSRIAPILGTAPLFSGDPFQKPSEPYSLAHNGGEL